MSELRIGKNIALRLAELGSAVIAIAQGVPGGAGQRHLSQQLLRAGTACGANYEEARAAESRADFVHKVSLAAKEARETVYWLRLIQARQPSAAIERAIDEASQLAAILTASARTARKNS